MSSWQARWAGGPGRRTWAVLALLGVLAGPGPAAAARARGGPLRVVATLPSLAALVHEVGGLHVEVRSLATVGEDPHFVDPTPARFVTLRDADLLLANGLELDQSWLRPVQHGSHNPRIQVGAPGYLEAATLIMPLEVPTTRIDRSMGDLHPGGNPHFLTAPEPMARIALGVAARLAELDPEHAQAYQAHARVLAEGLGAQADGWRRRFAALPAERRQVVTYHKSMAYLIAWLGLHEVGTLEPRPGVPPDPGHVASLLVRMRKHRVPVILQESYYPTMSSRRLAKLAPAGLVVLPGQVRFVGQDHQTTRDYLEQIAQAIWQVAAAGQAPAAG